MPSKYLEGWGWEDWHKPPPGAQINWSHPLARSLVAAWIMRDGWHDYTGRGNELTNSGALLLPSSNGLGATFNGSSDYLYLASNADLQTGAGSLTVLAAVGLTAAGSYAFVAKDTNSPANSRDWGLTYSTYAGGEFEFYINGGVGAHIAGVATGHRPYTPIGWWDAGAGTQNIQVSMGTVNSAGAAGPQSSAAQVQIGARQYAGSRLFLNGIVYHAFIWKRVLSATERWSMFEEPFAMFESPRFSIMVTAAPAAHPTFQAIIIG